MYCRQCGGNIPDESIFCADCGATLTARISPRAPPPLSRPLLRALSPMATRRHLAMHSRMVVPTSGAVSPGHNFGLVLLSMLIPIVGIIAGILYLRDPNPDKGRAGKIWLWVGLTAALCQLLFCSRLEATPY